MTHIAIDQNDQIIAGHARWQAAKLLGMTEVPCVLVGHLTPAERQAYLIADNQTAALAGWHFDDLASDFLDLTEAGIDLEDTGFSLPEIDQIITDFDERDPRATDAHDENVMPLPKAVVSKAGDLWRHKGHAVLCADSRIENAIGRVMGWDKANVVFTDPPFNDAVSSFSGKGRIKHPEFKQASGEMSGEEYLSFLTECLRHVAAACVDGAIIFSMIDWRHVDQMIVAGRLSLGELKNICVWDRGERD